MHTRISKVVEKSGLTKTGFGKRIGISQAYTSQLCSGAKVPSDRTITDICREFGANEVWLRTGEGEPFRATTQSEEIMRFAVHVAKGSDEFKKALVSMLANLSDDGWKGLQEMYDKLSEIYTKE